MTSVFHAMLCAGLAGFLFTCIGLPVATRIAPRSLALMIAPTLGWAVQSALALPVLCAVGWSQTAIIAMFAASVAVAFLALRLQPREQADLWKISRTQMAAMAAAAILSLAVMAAVLPKVSAEGVALASQTFDHSKIAIVDEMARTGVPPVNPFFGETGSPPRLSYYYLWHFSGAELAMLTGATGWEADAGLTGFTAFASLAIMIGFATWLSSAAGAGFWVVLLAATGSMRPIIFALLGEEYGGDLVGWPMGFGGWLFQAAWAPQHIASAGCAVLAAFVLMRLAKRTTVFGLVVFALLLVAGFESSAWVGGIAFPLAATVIVVAAVIGCAPDNRVRFMLGFGGAGLLAIAMASPLLYDQFTTTAMRGGSPVGFEPFEVLGFDLPDGINGIVDLAAYWAVFLVNEFPAFYLTGGVMLVALLKGRRLDDASKQIVVAFGLLTLVSLCVGWLLVSSGLGNNNDLGWRGVLPAVMLLIVFAAAALTRLTAKPLSLAALAAFALVAFGLPEAATLIKGNIKGATSPSAKAFAATPALWNAVRRNSDKSDRVANNPLFMEHVTPWPINISWALLSDRRSCFAGSDYAPFIALPKQRVDEIAAQFARVFDGKPLPDDIGELAKRYNCSVVVITPEDGAWKNDPFAAGPFYRLAEQDTAWRIYKSINLSTR